MTTRGGTGRVVVVGGHGMLGAMMLRVSAELGLDHAATQRRDPGGALYVDARAPAGEIETRLRGAGRFDVVINCIGITRVDPGSAASVEETYAVNGAFPWKLAHAARACGARVIHVSSDGVFRGRARPYTEASACDAADVYGISKRAGEPALPNTISVRTSIVGPAAGGQGLLEWLLRHPDGAEVPGYANHVWNGATTLQLARFMAALADERAFARLRARGAAVHYSPNQPLSKFELLRAINAAYGREIRVRPVEAPVPVTRVLATRLGRTPPLPAERGLIDHALRELARAAPLHEKSDS